jgi:hypothetical protein
MPSALLITMSRYPGVIQRLEEIRDETPGVQVDVEPACSFDDVPELLHRDYDMIALDGHGWQSGSKAYFGTSTEKPYLGRRFHRDYIRAAQASGIAAPIIVLAFCEGGTRPFRQVIEESISKPQVAFLGSTRRVAYTDAQRIYGPVLEALVRLGSGPDPAAAFRELEPIAQAIGRSWQAKLLHSRFQ